MHKHEIIHRDLRPECILLNDEQDECKVTIVDFGTNEKLGEKPNGKLNISPYYVAPEVLEYVYTEKCDMWSLGVILFMMLSGNPPFDGPNDD